MQWKDLRPGTVVYHNLLTHFGKGIVECVQGVEFLEGLFERGKRRAIVTFEGRSEKVRCRCGELRKTPNRKKIREMVQFYKARGRNVVHGGDRLILPETGTKLPKLPKQN